MTMHNLHRLASMASMLVSANCQLLLIIAFDLCRLKHSRLSVRGIKQAESAMRTTTSAGRNQSKEFIHEADQNCINRSVQGRRWSIVGIRQFVMLSLLRYRGQSACVMTCQYPGWARIAIDYGGFYWYSAVSNLICTEFFVGDSTALQIHVFHG